MSLGFSTDYEINLFSHAKIHADTMHKYSTALKSSAPTQNTQNIAMLVKFVLFMSMKPNPMVLPLPDTLHRNYGEVRRGGVL